MNVWDNVSKFIEKQMALQKVSVLKFLSRTCNGMFNRGLRAFYILSSEEFFIPVIITKNYR